ncbi:MAG TPA: glycosyltransferase family 2 protein [Kiritimatiellia bacterium]|nr:glycosyltransferase family 2 protein [Kiritimatiellia bacterium]HRZ11509.1 glycosyltransferase family 2 protein [Kiritimatiellia bacterium]HSA16940.1 glycosyltransferase family 2 protein [Kiritimatiellia bacterium]
MTEPTTQTTRPALSIVILAFNEVDNLRPVVEETKRAVAANPWIGTFEIVVVDDGSTDGTAGVADALAAENANVRAIHHPRNLGIGAGTRTGYGAAQGDYVMAVGADGEVEMAEVLQLVKLMDGADLAVSRRRRGPGAHRKLFTYGFHRLTSLIVGFNIEGMEGIYVVRRDILRDMELYSNTSLVNLEVIMQAVRRGCRIRSGEIGIHPRLSGESKMTNWRAIARVFREMLKLRWHLWRAGRRKKGK